MTAGRPDRRPARIAVIAGDGIGPEVIEAAIPILERVATKHGFSLAWERLPYPADHYLKTKEPLPAAALEHLRNDVDAIFLGALGDPRVPGNEHARDILLGLLVPRNARSEEHTSELQSRLHLVCRLLLEKKKKKLSSLLPLRRRLFTAPPAMRALALASN